MKSIRSKRYSSCPTKLSQHWKQRKPKFHPSVFAYFTTPTHLDCGKHAIITLKEQNLRCELSHTHTSVWPRSYNYEKCNEDLCNLQTMTFWFHSNSPQPAETQHADNTDLQQQVPEKNSDSHHFDRNTGHHLKASSCNLKTSGATSCSAAQQHWSAL